MWRVIALLVVVAPVAWAQDAPPPSPSPSAPAQRPPVQFSDLDAKLHHQPTRAEVDQRERERFGSAATKQQQDQEQAEIDRLNRELLGTPVPSAPK